MHHDTNNVCFDSITATLFLSPRHYVIVKCLAGCPHCFIHGSRAESYHWKARLLRPKAGLDKVAKWELFFFLNVVCSSAG